MDSATAKILSRKMQISEDYVIREEFELLVLKEIFESKFGKCLVFKGGTALRLVYGSPRFSEDLDFSLVEEVDEDEFLNVLLGLGKGISSIKEVGASKKFYTLFGLVKIKENFQERSFSIKIEVSRRKYPWIKDKDYYEKIIKSEASPLTLLANVVSLETILSDKIDAMKTRKMARDVYDYWFINQLLKNEVKPDFSGYDKERSVAELHKLLPHSYWGLVDSWLN